MTLIGCPECDEQVSDHALWCPHCGFPVAKHIAKTLAEVTGHDRARSARQKAAAEKLQVWARRYVEPERVNPDGTTEPASFVGRHRRVLLVGAVVLIVVLQLALLFSAIYG